MKKLFDRNEVLFAVILIIIYVVGSSVMMNLSEMTGIGSLCETVFDIALFAVLFIFITKNGLQEHLGLCGIDDDHAHGRAEHGISVVSAALAVGHGTVRRVLPCRQARAAAHAVIHFHFITRFGVLIIPHRQMLRKHFP